MWRTVPTCSQHRHCRKKEKDPLCGTCPPRTETVGDGPIVHKSEENISSDMGGDVRHKVRVMHRKLAATAKILSCRHSSRSGRKFQFRSIPEAQNGEGQKSISACDTTKKEGIFDKGEKKIQEKQKESEEYRLGERWLVAEVFLPALRREVDRFMEEAVKEWGRNTYTKCLFEGGCKGCGEPCKHYCTKLNIHLKGLGIGCFHDDGASASSFLQMSTLIALQTECKRAIKGFYKRWSKAREEWNGYSDLDTDVKQYSPVITLTTTFFDPVCTSPFYEECCKSFDIVVEKEDRQGAYEVGGLPACESLNCLCSRSVDPASLSSRKCLSPSTMTDFIHRDASAGRTGPTFLKDCPLRSFSSSSIPLSSPTTKIPLASASSSSPSFSPPTSGSSASYPSKSLCGSPGFSSSLLIIFAPHLPWGLLHNLFAANWNRPSCGNVSLNLKKAPKYAKQKNSVCVQEELKKHSNFCVFEEEEKMTEKKEGKEEDITCANLSPSLIPSPLKSDHHPLHHLLVISNDPRHAPLLSNPPKWCVFHPSFPSLLNIIPAAPSARARNGKRNKMRQGRKDRKWCQRGREKHLCGMTEENGEPSEGDEHGEEEEGEEGMVGFPVLSGNECFSSEDWEKAFHGTAFYSACKDLTGEELSRLLARISSTSPALVKISADEA